MNVLVPGTQREAELIRFWIRQQFKGNDRLDTLLVEEGRWDDDLSGIRPTRPGWYSIDLFPGTEIDVLDMLGQPRITFYVGVNADVTDRVELWLRVPPQPYLVNTEEIITQWEGVSPLLTTQEWRELEAAARITR